LKLVQQLAIIILYNKTINEVIKLTGKVKYSIVVPLYNEELVISESYRRLKDIMDSTRESYEIIFVNDGSYDTTRLKAEEICKNDDKIKLLNFSRNFGHQMAITAGMKKSIGDAIIIIDADLQDPPEVILKMIEKWKEGYEVVFGKRIKREGETFFKKLTANVFYRLLRSITSIDIPADAGDFRLIDRKVCNALMSLPEKNRYVRGLVSWVGYRQTYVEYVRKERFAGVTKYPLNKMLKLAFDGITSFSYKPLIMAGYFGVLSFAAGFISFIIILIKNCIENVNLLDLGLLLSIIFSMFGLTFISIGIMGQYIGRIFDECKNRPNYIIESTVNFTGADKIKENCMNN
jgi:glycosyltransferase involved in cell wall biosynthesis